MDKLNIGVIYLLCDPDTMDIRYVGQTIDNPRNRFYQHLGGEKMTYKGRWVSSLIRRHKRPKMVIYKVVKRGDLDRAEVDTIAYFKSHGHRLVNFTDGGSRMSDMDRARLSALRSGENNGCSKLTLSQINQIYQDYIIGGLSQKDLSRKYQCDIKLINSILNGSRWKTAWRSLSDIDKKKIRQKAKERDCKSHKLSEADILSLYNDYLEDSTSLADMSKKYNRDENTIRDILKGLTYKRVYANISESKKKRLIKKLADWKSRSGRPRNQAVL